MLATCQSHSLQHPHTPVGCGGVSDATREERKPPGVPPASGRRANLAALCCNWEPLREDFSDHSRTLIFPQDGPPPFYPRQAHWHAGGGGCQSREDPPTLHPAPQSPTSQLAASTFA